MLNKQADTRPTVLIVDDESAIRRVLRRLLEKDCAILEAEDGKEAWQRIQVADLDLVVSDVIMPKMNGYELCRMMKSGNETKSIPIILLTRKGDPDSTVQGLTIGADDYVSKPFNVKELKVRCLNQIGKRRMIRNILRDRSAPGLADLNVTSRDEAFIRKLTTLIQDRMGDRSLSVERLSEELGISKRQLSRVTKRTISDSPAALIRKLRIERAAYLMESGAGNISEIAYLVGFTSPAHFSRVFKAEMDLSPSEYLAKLENRAEEED